MDNAHNWRKFDGFHSSRLRQVDCAHCGKGFSTRHPRQKYCRTDCRPDKNAARRLKNAVDRRVRRVWDAGYFNDARAGVYFVRCTGTGRVKVGVTTHMAKRMGGLQGSSPAPIEMLVLLEGAKRDTEFALHQVFTALGAHAHMEWFEPTKPLLYVAAKFLSEWGSDGSSPVARPGSGWLESQRDDLDGYGSIPIVVEHRIDARVPNTLVTGMRCTNGDEVHETTCDRVVDHVRSVWVLDAACGPIAPATLAEVRRYLDETPIAGRIAYNDAMRRIADELGVSEDDLRDALRRTEKTES